jgi:hypothetical protein
MAFIEESDINEHTGTCHVGASSASGGAVANIADIKTRPIARSNPLDIAIKRLGGLHSSKLPSNGFVAGTIDTADQRRVSRSGISCETVRQ